MTERRLNASLKNELFHVASTFIKMYIEMKYLHILNATFFTRDLADMMFHQLNSLKLLGNIDDVELATLQLLQDQVNGVPLQLVTKQDIFTSVESCRTHFGYP